MVAISKTEFDGLCRNIDDEREAIIRNNPIGTPEEILLWMLMGVLVTYLSLPEIETPCFSGKPDAKTYQDAIRFILKGRMSEVFDPEPYFSLVT